MASNIQKINTMEPRKLLRPVATLMPLKQLVGLSKLNVIFPFYHIVSDNPPVHIRNLYRVKRISEFRSDLDILLKYFEPLSPSVLVSDPLLKSVKKPSFILSFDDGMREIKDNIVPVLNEKGIPAIFFLNNSFIDNKELFYRHKISILIDKIKSEETGSEKAKIISTLVDAFRDDSRTLIKHIYKLDYQQRWLPDKIAALLDIDFFDYLKQKEPYLSSVDIKDLISQGYYIGSHTYNHPFLSELHENQQLAEIHSSMLDVRERFKLDYSFFAFPFSDDGMKANFLGKLYNSDNQPTASFGTSGLRNKIEYPHYQRVPLEKSWVNAGTYLKTEYFYFLLKNIIKKPVR